MALASRLENGASASVGTSVRGTDIEVRRFGKGPLRALIIGGVHGDESEGFLFAERLRDSLAKGDVSIRDGVSLFLCARLNPDGCEALRRTNQNNVDLNRNLPTRDWTNDFRNVKYYPGREPGSEPESMATLALISEIDPAVIISLHSYENPMINYNGDCLDLALKMSAKNGLEPKGDIGYPTPGSLGTYAGWERNLPTLTLEILRGQDPETVWKTHLEGVLEAVHHYTGHPAPRRKNV